MRFRLRTLMILLALGAILLYLVGGTFYLVHSQKSPPGRYERELTTEQVVELMAREEAERDARRGFIRTDQPSTDNRT